MREIMLCRYVYDPLDRLAGTSSLSDANSQLFYCKNLLTTEMQGLVNSSIFQYGNQLLAQKDITKNMDQITLMVTNQQRSVFPPSIPNFRRTVGYSPYGYRSYDSGLLYLLGFNGERRDTMTGHYLLGNGYRAFNPVLMRFNSPDSSSPFGRGGLNYYSYCSGDPVNRKDPSGRYWKSIAAAFQKPLKRLARGAQPPAFRTDAPKRKPTNFAASQTPVPKQAALFKNNRAKHFSEELEAFQNALKTDPFEVLNVKSAQDLKHVGGSLPRRFVLTGNGALLIDPSVDLERRGINHAILASYGASESGVMSAGTISASPQQATIWNDSGHFRPDALSLRHVAAFLNDLGVEVTSIRLL